MADAAGWIALVATCVAALMTASNLGARVTGWGFLIFTVGAIAWIVVGLASHQTQLLYSNIFLGIVDVFGVWRWLGRRARISDTAQAEVRLSRRQASEDLFSVNGLDDLPVTSRDGKIAGHVADALAACDSGRIDTLIVRIGGVGGVGETLHRLSWNDVRMQDGKLQTKLEATAISRLPFAAN